MTPLFSHPDFTAPRFAQAANARFVPAPADGVLPDGFFSTTNLPTYVKLNGTWRMPREPRMDAALVLDADGRSVGARGAAREEGRRGRHRRARRTAREGIYVHADAFLGDSEEGEFKFMTSEVSREKPIDYSLMARILVDERDRGGYPVWVTGPALVHSRARADMVWFIANGFVGALLAGNAVAVHDIEASIFGTTLGMTRQRRSVDRRTRAAHARDQQGARRRLDRGGRRAGHHQGRHHARLRRARRAVRAHRLDSRRWPAART